MTTAYFTDDLELVNLPDCVTEPVIWTIRNGATAVKVYRLTPETFAIVWHGAKRLELAELRGEFPADKAAVLAERIDRLRDAACDLFGVDAVRRALSATFAEPQRLPPAHDRATAAVDFDTLTPAGCPGFISRLALADFAEYDRSNEQRWREKLAKATHTPGGVVAVYDEDGNLDADAMTAAAQAKAAEKKAAKARRKELAAERRAGKPKRTAAGTKRKSKKTSDTPTLF
jgi:hypothetical protein